MAILQIWKYRRLPHLIAGNWLSRWRAQVQPPAAIIGAYHERGTDELVYRAFKNFGFKPLPFRRFGANAAFCCVLVLAFELYYLFLKVAFHGVRC